MTDLLRFAIAQDWQELMAYADDLDRRRHNPRMYVSYNSAFDGDGWGTSRFRITIDISKYPTPILTDTSQNTRNSKIDWNARLIVSATSYAEVRKELEAALNASSLITEEAA